MKYHQVFKILVVAMLAVTFSDAKGGTPVTSLSRVKNYASSATSTGFMVALIISSL